MNVLGRASGTTPVKTLSEDISVEDFNRYTRIQQLVEKRTIKKNHWSALEVETMLLEVLCQVSEEEIDFLTGLEKRLNQPN